MAGLNASPHVRFFATQGTGSYDESRIAELLADVDAAPIPFDRTRKARSALRVLATLLRARPDLVVMEGTGLAGGVAIMLARALGAVRYVVSSGDAVSPFISARHAVLRPIAAAYERALCALSAGFIGWTPYLVGRALTFGAPRALTAPGWAPASVAAAGDRLRLRRELGIPAEAVVYGIVGSLPWNPRVGYCYGLELVRAVAEVDREDVRVLIVGDGSGLPRLRQVAAELPEGRVITTGAVPRRHVPAHLAAMDVASLPQSVDGVGAFRYTTKLSEYIAARLPIVTGELPVAYDLGEGWTWRLPGAAPWDPRYLDALSALMNGLRPVDVKRRREHVPNAEPLFSADRQRRVVGAFVRDLLAAPRADSRS